MQPKEGLILADILQNCLAKEAVVVSVVKQLLMKLLIQKKL